MRNESKNFPENAVFLQNGALVHTSHDAHVLLREILKKTGQESMTRETGPLDQLILLRLTFFMWGYEKDRGFKTPVNSLTQLKRRIMRGIRSITQEMIGRVWENLKNRLDAIIRESGARIQHL